MRKITIPASEVEPGDVWVGESPTDPTMKILRIMKREMHFAVPFGKAANSPAKAILHVTVHAEFSNEPRPPYRGSYTLAGDMPIEVERE